MRRIIPTLWVVTLYAGAVSCSLNSRAENLVAWWGLDETAKPEENAEPGTARVMDRQARKYDITHGPVEVVPGVQGKALKLDGYRSRVSRSQALDGGILAEGFTVEAWVALASFPWTWCPVIDSSHRPSRGFAFEIGPDGQVALKVAIGGQWEEVTSNPSIPLRTWTHIAAVFEPDKAMTLHVNGEQVAEKEITGPMAPSLPEDGLTLGSNTQAQVWQDRFVRHEAIHFFLDGILDEVQIRKGVTTGEELRTRIAQVTSRPEPALSARDRFPLGSRGSGSFGAFATRLDYFKEWDALWRVGDVPDIFVRFDDAPVQLVFWRGASFVPCWVTENEIWYTNEWTETWGEDVVSCAEPIMDRHCRFSHVRLIEKSDARVVIHWRYALNDAFYNFVGISDDGRGEWCDEYHIIYPDQVGIRKIDLHYSKPARRHDWVEQIVLLPPGKYPDDVIDRDAITLVNMQGREKTYTWHDEMTREMPDPPGANISLVNLKSEYRPFIVIPPDPVDTVEGAWDSPYWRSYATNMAKPEWGPEKPSSVFGWWDHWPVAQIPGDGRWVTTPDRPSHFNLTTFVQWKDHAHTEKTRSRIMLQGMTRGQAADLVPIARSWLQAPGAPSGSPAFRSDGYDQAERAFLVEKVDPESTSSCQLKVAASSTSPLINPAVIIRNWGRSPASLTVNGETIPAGKRFRQGTRQSIDGEDLIVWIEMESREAVTLELTPLPE